MGKTVFIAEEYIFYELIVETYVKKNNMITVGHDHIPDRIFDKIQSLEPDYAFIGHGVFKNDIFRAISKIRTISPQTKIIVVSEETNRFLVKSLKEEDVYGVLNKPFSEIQLINLFREYDKL